ncbi:MAG: NAD(P)H-dependent oxidoreductase [Propionibacteriaceae bacterium]|nr:NAD(P)H-dependent oxidoreductase [Propionibacteriaceae bacterium]
MKIGIVLSSIRDRRLGEGVAAWVKDLADQRGDADYELLDLKSFDVPLLVSGTHPMRANKTYDSAEVTAWSQAIDGCDAYVFVTPEYNHSVPGALKNAVDVLGPEWVGKAIGFVGYGSAGGVRAVEHWRQIAANLQMVDVRQQLELSLFTEFGADGFTPNERRAEELGVLLDQVTDLANKLA